MQSALEIAVDISHAAGDVTLDYWRRSDLIVEGKHDGSEVTAADRGAEAVARQMISERFPNDAVLGEEHGFQPGSSDRKWFIDPIDGTFGFVRGVPLYATLLAMVDAEGPAVGVIHLPALNRTVFAARGLGCFDNETRARVNSVDTLTGALVCASDWNAASSDQLLAVHGTGARMRTWGDAYGYAMVAAGEAEAMIDPICSAWDLAPMPVILSEAGGSFTDLEAKPAYDSGNGVASNGRIHAELLLVLNSGAGE